MYSDKTSKPIQVYLIEYLETPITKPLERNYKQRCRWRFKLVCF